MTDGMDGQMSFADLGLWCGKMSPEPCPQTTAKTSDASLKKPSGLPSQMPMCLDLRNGEMWGASWDMDGLLLGEYTMHSFGESPNAAVESHLSQILQENVPPKYYLSALACKGILRRSTERGKQIPELLRMVLERQSHSKTDAEKMGGAKESSYNMTEPGQSQPSTTKRSSLTANAFTQSSFGGYTEGVGTLRAKGGDVGGGSDTLIVTKSTLSARETRKE